MRQVEANEEARQEEEENPSIKAAQKWDAIAAHGRVRKNWAEFIAIQRHLNEKVCGRRLEGFNAGLNHQLAILLKGAQVKRAVSVGSGAAAKEITLLKQGLIDRFDLFDISPTMRDKAQENLERFDLADRVTISGDDAFEAQDGTYDLVHWNSALHHMLDTRAALEWSHRVLAPGGMLYMSEYVGPNQFQWTPRQLELANRFRRALPKRFRRDAKNPDRLRRPLARAVRPEVILADDPTEAVDSATILPAVHEYFPEARIWHLGGVVYRIGLTHLHENFDEEQDREWLEMVLVADDYCIDLGESLFAAALAVKPD